MAGLSAQVNVRIPEAEYRTLSQAAAATGASLGVYLRRAGLAQAQRELAEEHGSRSDSDWRAKLPAKDPPESRSTDRGAPGGGRRSPVASAPAPKGGMHGNRSVDTTPEGLSIAQAAVIAAHDVAPPSSKEAIVADLKAKVDAVGKGLQGSGTTEGGGGVVLTGNDAVLCPHPKAKVVQGASGVAVKVCPDCGERGL